VPGAIASGGVSALPLSQMFAWGPITVEGRPLQPGEAFINVDERIVGGDYFRAMEIPLLEGRLFTEQDTRTNPRVVIIDDDMARQIWPAENALGKRVRAGGIDASATAPWLTVVGIVAGVKQYTLDGDSRIAMYLPHTQVPTRAMNVVLRTVGDPGALAAAASREVRALAPDLPIYNVRTMKQRVDESLARRRFSMLLLTLFAALALGLAAIGSYGVIAYLVTQGARDLGIRMALGATPGAIVRLILRHGMSVALIGVAAGLAGAFVLSRFMRSLLFGVGPADPVTFAAVSLLLMTVALVASYIPARRAARIDPMVSLRTE
jgi:predicted permease